MRGPPSPLRSTTNSARSTEIRTAPRSTTSRIGSGAGVAQFIANTVDYGASDVALKDDEVSQARKKGTPLNVKETP